MTRMVVCWWLVVGLAVCAAGVAVAADQDKAPDKRADERLDQPVSIAVAYDSLDEFCARLRQMSDVSITCDPVIKEHKVVVRVREQPLREVMRQLAVLFDFTWMQGPQEHPRYHLLQTTARVKKAKDLREQLINFTKDGQERRLETFHNALWAVQASPDELHELARTDPDAVAMAVMQPEGCQVLASLSDEQRAALLDGEPVWISFSDLPAEVQASIKRYASKLGERASRDPAMTHLEWRWDDVQIGYEPDWPDVWPLRPWFEMDSVTYSGFSVLGFSPSARWSDYERWRDKCRDEGGPSHELFPDGRPLDDIQQRLATLEYEYGIDIRERAKNEGVEPLPEWIQPQRDGEPPVPSGECVSIGLSDYDPDTGEYKGDPRKNMRILLLAVAEHLDLNLVADCYWTRSVWRGKYAPRTRPPGELRYPAFKDEAGMFCVDANAEYALDRTCQYEGYGWEKEGEFFRVRNPAWALDDVAELPKSVLDEWVRRTDHEKHITVDDYLYLVSKLTQEQAWSVSRTDYLGSIHYDSTGTLRDEWGQEVGAKSWSCDTLEHAALMEGSRYTRYWALRLYALLPAGLRAAAERSGISVARELPEAGVRVLQKIADIEKRRGMDQQARGPKAGQQLAESLADARLWAGYEYGIYRIIDSPTGPAGKLEPRYVCRRFYIGLWREGTIPDPNLPGGEEGCIWVWWFELVSKEEAEEAGGESERADTSSG